MQSPESIVLCSAISEVFLRKLAKQGYVRYIEGSEFVDTREDLIEQGDADGGGLKEMDEKLKTRIENLKDMVLYRFGSTGVVQVLSRAADLLGLVPVFPIRNIHSMGSTSGEDAVFKDCVLVKRGTTVKECARKIMGDAPLAYVEGAGGVRVSEDEVVSVGKYDVSRHDERHCILAHAGCHRFYLSKWGGDAESTLAHTYSHQHARLKLILVLRPDDYLIYGREESYVATRLPQRIRATYRRSTGLRYLLALRRKRPKTCTRSPECEASPHPKSDLVIRQRLGHWKSPSLARMTLLLLISSRPSVIDFLDSPPLSHRSCLSQVRELSDGLCGLFGSDPPDPSL